MSYDAALNVERLIFEAWEMGMSNGELIDYVLKEIPVSRDFVECVLADLISRMSE
jgi:hypothetical protein